MLDRPGVNYGNHYLDRAENIAEGRLLTKIALLTSWRRNLKSLYEFVHFIGGKIGL